MADIRIKDLTTTASSTASDDFIAVDGTTNGTRKLNAFSPTFGGNATVTGTLTVNGSGTYGSINMPSATTLGGGLAFGTDITIYRNFANQLSTTAYALTGGVSGAGYFSIIASGSSVLTFNNGNGESFRVGASRGVNIGDTADVAAGSLKVSGTTASTTTSTGALVVGNGTSGGLGVGGAIVAGGTITSTASTDSGLLQLNLVNSSTGTSASSLFRFNAGTRTATLQAYNDTHATLAGQLRVGTSDGSIVLIPSGVTAATFTASGTTFAGAISIGNTVNTVSPTSPNRTITMVIGGTTYYLAAKTTND